MESPAGSLATATNRGSLTTTDWDEAARTLAANGFDIAQDDINKEEALQWVCQHGKLNAFHLLIELGVDISAAPENLKGKAALHCAAAFGRADLIEPLLKLGADVSARDDDGDTALHYCAWGPQGFAAFQLLVDAGSDITWVDDKGDTVLHTAANHGRQEILEAILKDIKTGTIAQDIDVRDGDGQSPLHVAAWGGSDKAVELLLDVGGADIAAKDDQERSALHLATAKRSLPTVKALLQRKADIEAKDSGGRTALHIAAERGEMEILLLLLESGADIQSVTEQDRTALHYSAVMGHEEAMRLLIRRGADMEARDNLYGLTPLALAAWAGYEDTMAVPFLIDQGADALTTTDDGWTTLHLAADSDQRLVAQFLLKSFRTRKVLDNQASDGETALAVAARKGHKDMTTLLLKHGAEVNIADYDGDTALHGAVSSGHMDVAKILLKHGADPTLDTGEGIRLHLLTEVEDDRQFLLQASEAWASKNEKSTLIVRFLVAAGQGHVDQLERILQSGLDINSTDENGRRALSLASKNGHETAIKFLVEHKADINGADKNGENALWWAARYGHEQSVQYLLEKGCHVNTADDFGQTPLSVAAQMGHESIVRILLDKKADVNTQTRYGTSALAYASQKGYLAVVDLLLQNGANIGLESQDGDTAVSLAEDNGYDEVVELLLQHGKNSDGPTPEATQPIESAGIPQSYHKDLAGAAKRGGVAYIRRLLRVGTPADCSDDTGRSPLSLAAERGHDSAVMELLQAGADVNFVPGDKKDKRSPLWWAAHQGNISTMIILAGAGAQIEAKNEDGETPLSVAAQSGREEAVRYLLHVDAKTESRDNKGYTPLFHAARAGHKTIIAMLLDHGANMECGDFWGRTPLFGAVEAGQRDSTRLLLERGAKMRPESRNNMSPLCAAAQDGHEELVELLLNHDADVDYLSDNRRTALMLAADQGNAMVVKILIEHGANVDLRDDDKHNAVSYAKYAAQEETLQLLWQAATIRKAAISARAQRKVQENSFNTQEWYEYEPLSDEGVSIRVLELHPGTSQDIISLDLHIVHLDKIRQKPAYEALSYEWGEKFGTIPIQCNGGRLLVTPNLRAILEELRSPTEARLLWVDAVCINQEDIAERGSQVALMTRIYREATRVIMYIGRERDHTREAFSSLPAFTKAYDEVFGPLGSIRDFKEGDEERVRQVLAKSVDKAALEGMAELYESPYFTRAWIFQEILLSGPKGDIVCGAYQCSWETMRKALLAFSCNKRYGISLKSFNLLQLMECEATFSEKGQLRLEDLSDMRKYFKATDPRDKVYATLGVISQQGKELVPDYRLGVRDVYTNATRYLIQRTQSFGHWWTVCNRASIKTTENLPSWVPDWIAEEPRSPIYGSNADFVREVTYLGARKFGRFVRGDPKTTSTTLSVNGYLLDKVTFGISLLPGDDVYEGMIKPLALHLASVGRSLFEPCSQIPTILNLEAVWDTMFQKNARRDEGVEFLAWKISVDADLPESSRKVPSIYEAPVHKWAELSTKATDYDFSVCKLLESKIHHTYDLLYTVKGRFGLTNLNGAEVGAAVAILGNAVDISLLRERGSPDERWYQYLDRAFIPDLEKMEKVEDIEIQPKIDRLEIM